MSMDDIIKFVPPGKPQKRIRFPNKYRCQPERCKHFDADTTPGNDYCEGCVRGYLGMPDKFEPREK